MLDGGGWWRSFLLVIDGCLWLALKGGWLGKLKRKIQHTVGKSGVIIIFFPFFDVAVYRAATC